MPEDARPPILTFEVRVMPGRSGLDPNDPDWEILRVESGANTGTELVEDNLTQAEAQERARILAGAEDDEVTRDLTELRKIYKSEGE